jgi:hypothetical protein
VARQSSRQRPPLLPGSGAVPPPSPPCPLPPALSAAVWRPPAPASGSWRPPPWGRIRRRVEAERGVVAQAAPWRPPPSGEESARLGKRIAGAMGLAEEGRAWRTRDPSSRRLGQTAPTARGLASPPPGRTGRTRPLVRRRAPRLLASAGSFLQNVHLTDAG